MRKPSQRGKIPSLQKPQKLAKCWWCVPVVLPTWEAEEGELLEHRKQRLRRLRQENYLKPENRSCSEPGFCHCTAAW
ncbi:hypothetical protein AAY473_010639 [Plecturocebus cupreus]